MILLLFVHWYLLSFVFQFGCTLSTLWWSYHWWISFPFNIWCFKESLHWPSFTWSHIKHCPCGRCCHVIFSCGFVLNIEMCTQNIIRTIHSFLLFPYMPLCHSLKWSIDLFYRFFVNQYSNLFLSFTFLFNFLIEDLLSFLIALFVFYVIPC